MSGYDWDNGKSNRAVQAEERGLIVLSKITKKMLPNVKGDIKNIRKYIKNMCEPSEWHHTSKFFNETNYYNIEYLNKVLPCEINEPKIELEQHEMLYSEFKDSKYDKLAKNKKYDSSTKKITFTIEILKW